MHLITFNTGYSHQPLRGLIPIYADFCGRLSQNCHRPMYPTLRTRTTQDSLPLMHSNWCLQPLLRPIFECQAGYLSKVGLIARDKECLVFQHCGGNLQIVGANTQLLRSQFVEALDSRVIKSDHAEQCRDLKGLLEGGVSTCDLFVTLSSANLRVPTSEDLFDGDDGRT